MKVQRPSFKRLMESTRQHISRNKWLSVATITVILITFVIATLFVALLVVSSRTINEFEKRAQIIIFFQSHTEESEIESVKSVLLNTGLLSSIEYISEDQAVEIYKGYYQDYPTLIESVTTDDVLPSLELRATRVEDMPQLKEFCDSLANQNSSIDSVMYFKDLVETLRGISKVINIGGAVLLSALAAMSIVLILITIGFNINAHRHEIEVMQLIGSPDGFIRIPFLLEGTIYGIIGSALATIALFILWYGVIYLLKGNDLFLFISQTFNDVSMPYMIELDPIFITGTLLAEITIGAIIGYISSSIALWKYLK